MQAYKSIYITIDYNYELTSTVTANNFLSMA